jgi:hypothetical protein
MPSTCASIWSRRPALLLAALILGLCTPLGGRDLYLPDGGLLPADGFPAEREGVRITTWLAKAKYRAGEKAVVLCRIANVGEEPLIMERPLGGSASAPDYVYLTDARGRTLVSSLHAEDAGGWRPGRPIEPWVIVLEPGQSHTYSLDLARYFAREAVCDHPGRKDAHLEMPGTYRVQCLYANWWNMPEGAVWNGVVAGEPRTFEIVGATED